ncbi:MAG: HEAT repeat domain-containing protein, partial [Candidatus Limnocylindrales bacterium]
MPLFGPPNVGQMEAKRDVQGLIKALSYKDPAVRRAAADALGPLKDPIAVEPLAAGLRDEDPRVRRSCVEALAIRGGLRVIDPLVAALADADADVRARA